MIKFRQKEFFWGAALNVGMLGTSVLGIKQGADAQKEAEIQSEAMMESNKKMTAALDKIAETAKTNPQVANATQEVMRYKTMSDTSPSRVKIFSAPVKNTFRSNAKGFGKDIWTLAKNNKQMLAGGAVFGVGMTGISYLTNKAIQKDLKRSGVELTNKDGLKISSKSYSSTGSILGKVGRTTKDAIKGNWKSTLGFGIVLGAVPTGIGYLSEKKQLVEQAKQSSQQKSYSASRAAKLASVAKKGGQVAKKTSEWQDFKAAPLKATLGFVSHLFQGGGRRGVRNTGEFLSKSNNSEWSRKAGNFLKKHERTSLVGSLGVGMGIMGATWGVGEKVTKAALNAADKNAFAYDNMKEKKIE